MGKKGYNWKARQVVSTVIESNSKVSYDFVFFHSLAFLCVPYLKELIGELHYPFNQIHFINP